MRGFLKRTVSVPENIQASNSYRRKGNLSSSAWARTSQSVLGAIDTYIGSVQGKEGGKKNLKAIKGEQHPDIDIMAVVLQFKDRPHVWNQIVLRVPQLMKNEQQRRDQNNNHKSTGSLFAAARRNSFGSNTSSSARSTQSTWSATRNNKNKTVPDNHFYSTFSSDNYSIGGRTTMDDEELTSLRWKRETKTCARERWDDVAFLDEVMDGLPNNSDIYQLLQTVKRSCAKKARALHRHELMQNILTIRGSSKSLSVGSGSSRNLSVGGSSKHLSS